MVSNCNSSVLPVATSCLRAPLYVYRSNVENCFPLLKKTELIHKPFTSVCHDYYFAFGYNNYCLLKPGVPQDEISRIRK